MFSDLSTLLLLLMNRRKVQDNFPSFSCLHLTLIICTALLNSDHLLNKLKHKIHLSCSISSRTFALTHSFLFATGNLTKLFLFTCAAHQFHTSQTLAHIQIRPNRTFCSCDNSLWQFNLHLFSWYNYSIVDIVQYNRYIILLNLYNDLSMKCDIQS